MPIPLTTSGHLERLVLEGIVTAEKKGRGTRYVMAAATAAAPAAEAEEVKIAESEPQEVVLADLWVVRMTHSLRACAGGCAARLHSG